MNVVFMGTPQFAVPSLKMLIDEKYNIVCVVTQPDRKKGRGGGVVMPPIKELALERGVRVYQPVSIKADEAYHMIAGLQPDLFITVAYGGIIDKRLLDTPRFGCVNVHGSLLPKYRGPAPIQWAIINGESETGITTMLTDVGVDTGGMLLSDRLALTEDMYFPAVHDKLSELGALTLKKTIPLWVEGRITPQAQDDAVATRARMLKKEDGLIDLGRSAKEVVNSVRGLNPWPGAYAQTDAGKVKFIRAHVADEDYSDADIGCVVETSRDGLVIKCGVGAVAVTMLQFENGRAMDISECWHNLKIGIIKQ